MDLQSTQTVELIKALLQVQKEIRNPTKSLKNPFFKSSYAGLESVLIICRDILPENGITFIQAMMPIDGQDYLCTTLYHSSGQWIRSLSALRCKDPHDPQKFGSAVTYHRRYALMALLGIVGSDEDDDGNKATIPQPTGCEARASKVQIKKLLDLIGARTDILQKVVQFIEKQNGDCIHDLLDGDFEKIEKSVIGQLKVKAVSDDS